MIRLVFQLCGLIALLSDVLTTLVMCYADQSRVVKVNRCIFIRTQGLNFFFFAVFTSAVKLVAMKGSFLISLIMFLFQVCLGGVCIVRSSAWRTTQHHRLWGRH